MNVPALARGKPLPLREMNDRYTAPSWASALKRTSRPASACRRIFRGAEAASMAGANMTSDIRVRASQVSGTVPRVATSPTGAHAASGAATAAANAAAQRLRKQRVFIDPVPEASPFRSEHLPVPRKERADLEGMDGPAFAVPGDLNAAPRQPAGGFLDLPADARLRWNPRLPGS